MPILAVLLLGALCGCDQALAWMSEYDVDSNASARAEYLSLNPRRTVPTIKVGNEVIVGFSEGAVGKALDDAASEGQNPPVGALACGLRRAWLGSAPLLLNRKAS